MPDHPQRITALIIARDEGRNLADCLAALAWTDEIVVVVDRASRDETEAVARQNADVVLLRDFDDFANQRNAGLALASGDWILSVDADERATVELAAEIREKIACAVPPLNGFRVPIRSVILGRSFSFSGTQHDKPLRLFRRLQGGWIEPVHEIVELEGDVAQLAHSLQHRTIPDMREFLHKIDRYTTLEALRFNREGRPIRILDYSARPFWTFLKLYFYKQGFRDGLEGFIFCVLSGVSVLVRHWKQRELSRTAGRAL